MILPLLSTLLCICIDDAPLINKSCGFDRVLVAVGISYRFEKAEVGSKSDFTDFTMGEACKAKLFGSIPIFKEIISDGFRFRQTFSGEVLTGT